MFVGEGGQQYRLLMDGFFFFGQDEWMDGCWNHA